MKPEQRHQASSKNFLKHSNHSSRNLGLGGHSIHAPVPPAEAQLVKLINPFLLDPIDKGGLGLTTGQVGIVYGTVGIIGLTIGGIIGGIVAAERRP